MAITSNFYTGPVDNVEWATGTSRLGYQYVVGGNDDFKVEVDATGTRAVNVRPGIAMGGGVLDTSDATEQVVLANVAEGSIWYLIGLRRVWGATNATTVDQIIGTSTMQLPTRPTEPGVEDFQPLALVQITFGETLPTSVVDLRAVSSNSGVLVAFHDMARSYLDAPGTLIRIGDDAQWVRNYDGAGIAAWTPQWLATNAVGSTVYDTGWVDLVAAAGWQGVSGYAPQFRRIGPMVWMKGRLQTASGSPVTGTHAPAYIPSGYDARPLELRESVGILTKSAFRIHVGTDGRLNFWDLPNVSQVYVSMISFCVN